MDRWERTDGIIDRIEQILIVLFLSLMILVAFLQIILRNLFDTGLSWGDSLIRNLVLWIGFMGATLATREGKHINIDVVSRWLPTRGNRIVSLIIHLFSFFICILLTYASLKFIKNEAQMGEKTFLKIPQWVLETILPITFGLMSFRFGLRFFKTLVIGRKIKMVDQKAKPS
ncbi:MAG: TRAP transporter small permease [Thermodesulfobacteriota bacterium]